jgi:hypothetical protein
MKNLNADFLLDIWADLKAKRLAPVAIGLIAAVVAMPALLLKGDDAPSAGPLPIVAAPSSSGDGAEVELAEELADGSKLDSYKAHDPFSGVGRSAGTTDAGASGTAVAPGDDTTSDSLLKFGRPGREKRYRHLSRMSFLPSAKVPALLFMGVPVDAKSAIFFVHPSLSHQGEGECIPSEANCNFIQLAIGRDEFLAVNDYEFRLRLLGVHRVKLDPDAGSARKTTGTHRSARDGGEGALGSGAGVDDRGLPALVDGIG